MKNKKTILLIISALLLSVIGCGDGMTPQEREAANAQRSSAAELGHPIESATEKQPEESGEQNQGNAALEQRIRELEAEVRTLRKQLGEKEEVIDVLKKSVGILSKP